MGGCRCTYKNCTVKSDGKTHLFHFPVFDKVRCHQWLTNSGRYDFLNLTVSQLKNRCICQHHFADYYFMNTKKDKLKLDAIPTEDGPYCTPVPKEEIKKADQIFSLYSITHDDIENDDYICDRKANYKIKYVDFLTSCEQLDSLEDSVKSTQDTKKSHSQHREDFEDNFKTHVFTSQNNNSVIPKELPISNIHSKNSLTSTLLLPDSQIQTMPVYVHKIDDKSTKKNVSGVRSKVKIISEKKITEPEKKIPVPVSSGSFETVSPSMVLNVNKKTDKIAVDASEPQANVQVPSNDLVEDSANPSRQFEIEILQEIVELPPPKEEPSEDKPAKVPAPNKKMSAERIAAINEKRQFNMRLKDIIQAGLTRLDKRNEPQNKAKSVVNLQTQQSRTETVASSLSKEISLPNHSDYIVSFLEARMKRMESLLLNKIDQNSQKIMDLKNSLETQTEADTIATKQSTRSTKSRSEAHKRQLYKEISKYLSPDVNSLVYEELFINQYSLSNDDFVPTKRKRTAAVNKA